MKRENVQVVWICMLELCIDLRAQSVSVKLVEERLSKSGRGLSGAHHVII